MQRFFCRVCQKVKRVRTLPFGTPNDQNVVDRVNVCRWHANPAPRAAVNDRVLVVRPTKKPKASHAAQ